MTLASGRTLAVFECRQFSGWECFGRNMLFVTLNQAGEQHGEEDLWHAAALFTKIGVASFSLFLRQSRKMCVCDQLWQIMSVGTWLALWITFIFLKVKVPAKQCFTKHYDMVISSQINMLATRIMIQSDGNAKHLTPLTLFLFSDQDTNQSQITTIHAICHQCLELTSFGVLPLSDWEEFHLGITKAPDLCSPYKCCDLKIQSQKIFSL